MGEANPLPYYVQRLLLLAASLGLADEQAGELLHCLHQAVHPHGIGLGRLRKAADRVLDPLRTLSDPLEGGQLVDDLVQCQA